MKCVFHASNGLEAHMVADLLNQTGVMAQVHGDLLQGGVGELPAAGLASVWVADSDAGRAVEVIRDFERRQPPNPPAEDLHRSAKPGRFVWGFLLGLLCGVGLALGWLAVR